MVLSDLRNFQTIFRMIPRFLGRAKVLCLMVRYVKPVHSKEIENLDLEQQASKIHMPRGPMSKTSVTTIKSWQSRTSLSTCMLALAL